MLHARSIRLCASLAAVIAAAACDSGRLGGDHYLSPGLRAAVDELKSDVAAAPTDASTIATRARVLADWADAYSMAGGEVGLEGPRIRLQSSLPPSGRAAINQSANLDRLVFLEPEGNGARFSTHTRGDWSSLRITLSNVRPGASIVLDLEEARETGSAPPFVRPPLTIPGQRVRLGLADMRRGQLERGLPVDGYPDEGITLRWIISDGERDVEFSYTDEREPREGDYYYVRVRRVNDAMAWSSPVWVGGYASR